MINCRFFFQFESSIWGVNHRYLFWFPTELDKRSMHGAFMLALWMSVSDLYELVGFGGVCPGSRDLVARPHDGDALSWWMMVEHNHLRRKENERQWGDTFKRLHRWGFPSHYNVIVIWGNTQIAQCWYSSKYQVMKMILICLFLASTHNVALTWPYFQL